MDDSDLKNGQIRREIAALSARQMVKIENTRSKVNIELILDLTCRKHLAELELKLTAAVDQYAVLVRERRLDADGKRMLKNMEKMHDSISEAKKRQHDQRDVIEQTWKRFEDAHLELFRCIFPHVQLSNVHDRAFETMTSHAGTQTTTETEPGESSTVGITHRSDGEILSPITNAFDVEHVSTKAGKTQIDAAGSGTELSDHASQRHSERHAMESPMSSLLRATPLEVQSKPQSPEPIHDSSVTADKLLAHGARSRPILIEDDASADDLLEQRHPLLTKENHPRWTVYDKHDFSTIDARRVIQPNAPGQYMHYIEHLPDEKGVYRFFTMQCDVCQVHFSDKPEANAKEHVRRFESYPDEKNADLHRQLFNMDGVRFNGPITLRTNLLKVFGIEVTGCDATKQRLSNEAFVSKVNKHKHRSTDPNPYNVLAGKYGRLPKRRPVEGDLRLERPYESMEECLRNKPGASTAPGDHQQPPMLTSQNPVDPKQLFSTATPVKSPKTGSDTSPSAGMSQPLNTANPEQRGVTSPSRSQTQDEDPDPYSMLPVEPVIARPQQGPPSLVNTRVSDYDSNLDLDGYTIPSADNPPTGTKRKEHNGAEPCSKRRQAPPPEMVEESTANAGEVEAEEEEGATIVVAHSPKESTLDMSQQYPATSGPPDLRGSLSHENPVPAPGHSNSNSDKQQPANTNQNLSKASDNAMETIRELDISRALREASGPAGSSPSKQKEQASTKSPYRPPRVEEISDEEMRREKESRRDKNRDKSHRKNVVDDSGPPSGEFPHRGPLPTDARTAKRKTKIRMHKKHRRSHRTV